MFLDHLFKKRITVQKKKWHSLMGNPPNLNVEHTINSILGHRKCYNSDFPFQDWRRWGKAIISERLCVFI